MASLMFRCAKDNRYYAEDKRPVGKGTWYVFYYDFRGKKVRQRIGPNKRPAELAKGDIEAKLEKQRAGLLDPEQEVQRIRAVEYAKRLPDFLKTEGKAPKTINRYAGVFEKLCQFIQQTDSHVKYLDQIDAPLIERYKDNRREQHVTRNGHPNAPIQNGVSPRTLNNELTFLHTLFNLAKSRGYIRRNPLQDVRKLSAQKGKHYEPLTEEQIRKLLDTADTSLRPILLTFLLTGMRTGELLNLEWDDIDFERDEIHIRLKADWQPKDKEARTIPLHHQLKATLERLKRTSTSRYVFGKGVQPCPNKLLIRLQRACKRAEVPVITVHNLRDEFASHLVMQGIGIETVSKLLGHSNIQITYNHYIHLAPRKLKQAVETLAWDGLDEA